VLSDDCLKIGLSLTSTYEASWVTCDDVEDGLTEGDVDVDRAEDEVVEDDLNCRGGGAEMVTSVYVKEKSRSALLLLLEFDCGVCCGAMWAYAGSWARRVLVKTLT
jgi:hypothetical protein